MKSFLKLIMGILMVSMYANAWDLHPIGGGNAEKIITVDENVGGNNVQGAFFFEKDGGAFWMPYTNGTWGNWQNLDAYYGWHMGGDVCKIGNDLYALNVTMQGWHKYKYNTSTSNWDYYAENMQNNYFWFHDAQFYKDNGNYDPNRFLVCTWQGWEPTVGQNAHGIFDIQTGWAPEQGDDPIDGTLSKVYGKLYRAPRDGRYVYALRSWKDDYGKDLASIEIINTSWNPMQIDNEFVMSGYTLMNINGFYQYVDDSDFICQYMLAETKYYNNASTVDVWYRGGYGPYLGSQSWVKKWSNINITGGVSGLAARRYSTLPTKHYIYTFAQRVGLVLYDTYNDQTTYFYVEDLGLPMLSTNYITRTQWQDGSDDWIIIGINKGGNVFVKVDPANGQYVQVVSRDQWATSGQSVRPQLFSWDSNY
jgi:hypothetical protein